MKVITLGKIAQNKLCNIHSGVVFSPLNEHLEVSSDIYMTVLVDETKVKYNGDCVDLRTGKMTKFHPSTRVKIYQDAAIILDPIDKD